MYPIGALLSVYGFCWIHYAIYYGNGMVFQSSWENGLEIVPLEEFSRGRKIFVLTDGVDDTHEFFARVHQSLSQHRPYCVLTNNCEHAVSSVLVGEARSPQIDIVTSIVFCISIYALLRR